MRNSMDTCTNQSTSINTYRIMFARENPYNLAKYIMKVRGQLWTPTEIPKLYEIIVVQ